MQNIKVNGKKVDSFELSSYQKSHKKVSKKINRKKNSALTTIDRIVLWSMLVFFSGVALLAGLILIFAIYHQNGKAAFFGIIISLAAYAMIWIPYGYLFLGWNHRMKACSNLNENHPDFIARSRKPPEPEDPWDTTNISGAAMMTRYNTTGIFY